jgi:hypothetical protein
MVHPPWICKWVITLFAHYGLSFYFPDIIQNPFFCICILCRERLVMTRKIKSSVSKHLHYLRKMLEVTYIQSRLRRVLVHDIYTVHCFISRNQITLSHKLSWTAKLFISGLREYAIWKKKIISHIMHRCSHFRNVCIILQVDMTCFHFLVYFSCSEFVFPVGLAVLK